MHHYQHVILVLTQITTTFRSGPECASMLKAHLLYTLVNHSHHFVLHLVRNVQHIDITLCGILFCRSLHQLLCCNQYHAMTRCYHLMLHCQVQYIAKYNQY